MKDIFIQIDSFGRALQPTEDAIKIFPSLNTKNNNVLHLFSESKEKIMFSRYILNDAYEQKTFHLTTQIYGETTHVNIIPVQTSQQRFIIIKKLYKKQNIETFWNQFTKSFPGGLIFINPHMEILELTQATIHLLKLHDNFHISYSKANLIGKNILDVCPQSIQDKIKDKISTPHGSYIELENTFLSLSFQDLYQGSKLTGSCLFIFDHTEIVNLNSVLDQQKQNMVNNARLASLGEMAAGVAHEINNPLSIISMRANFLKKIKQKNKLDDEKFYAYIDQIELSTQRVASIVKGLRTISRDSEQDGFEYVNIISVMNLVMDLANEKLKYLNIQLDTSQVDSNLSIHCNSVQISQVLINLINNSIDAIKLEKEKHIWVKTEQQENHIFIRVTDSGPKIDSLIAEKITQPFFTTKPVGEGTGLGLSISKSILNSHKGDLYLDLESEYNSFVLKFPHVKEHLKSDKNS